MSKEIKPQISKKINYFFKKMNSCRTELSKPDVNNLKLVCFSVLKEQTPLLNPLLSLVDTGTNDKHKEKRLRSFIGKKALASSLSEDYLKTVSPCGGGIAYCLVDQSDLIKKYGRMEFIKRIRDGSSGDFGYGYHILNILGSDHRGETLTPLYSELYSMREPGIRSENRKILDAISLTRKYVNKGMYVMDRGFDRNILYKDLMSTDTHFITRLKSQRYLYIGGALTAPRLWRKKVGLKYEYLFKSISRQGKRKKKNFRCGCRQVSLDIPGYEDKTLWLVVMKRVRRGITRSQGFSYYLSFLPEGIQDEKEVVDTVTRGYGHRWKIEEYHRFLKTELNFEKMRFARYEALKTMTVIMMIAAYFIFRCLKRIFLEKIMEGFRKRDWQRYMEGCVKFIYYDLARLIKREIYSMKLYQKDMENAPPPIANLFTIAGVDDYAL